MVLLGCVASINDDYSSSEPLLSGDEPSPEKGNYEGTPTNTKEPSENIIERYLPENKGLRNSLPSSLHDVEKLAAKVCEVAREAGAVELKIYNAKEDFKVKMKDDEFGYVSPTTEADKAATDVICRMLEEFDKGIPIVIEELKMDPWEKRKDYGYYWCIDPLDGTKEFLKRNGQFTVNIGLVNNNKPVFGAVYVPTQDVMYYGGTLGNFGAWKLIPNQKPEKIHAATFSMSDEKLTIVASASHCNQETSNFIKQFKNPTLKSMGSSLKLLLVAEGTAHCYPRIAPTFEWDTAAAHSIVNAAGGCVLNADVIYEKYEDGKPHGLVKNPDGGKPVLYNKKSPLNPYFVVYGNLVK